MNFRTHTAHYSPVMIAPLSINSSHADYRPERSFFSAIPCDPLRAQHREQGRLQNHILFCHKHDYRDAEAIGHRT
jgi:hypothetical protein